MELTLPQASLYNSVWQRWTPTLSPQLGMLWAEWMLNVLSNVAITPGAWAVSHASSAWLSRLPLHQMLAGCASDSQSWDLPSIRDVWCRKLSKAWQSIYLWSTLIAQKLLLAISRWGQMYGTHHTRTHTRTHAAFESCHAQSCVLQQTLHANQCRSCRGCVQADERCLTEVDNPEFYRCVGCTGLYLHMGMHHVPAATWPQW